MAGVRITPEGFISYDLNELDRKQPDFSWVGQPNYDVLNPADIAANRLAKAVKRTPLSVDDDRNAKLLRATDLALGRDPVFISDEIKQKEEAFKYWPLAPAKMLAHAIHSGATFAGDMIQGKVPVETSLNVPYAVEPYSGHVAYEKNRLGFGSGYGPNPEHGVARSFDMAGLLGGASFARNATNVAKEPKLPLPVEPQLSRDWALDPLPVNPVKGKTDTLPWKSEADFIKAADRGELAPANEPNFKRLNRPQVTPRGTPDDIIWHYDVGRNLGYKLDDIAAYVGPENFKRLQDEFTRYGKPQPATPEVKAMMNEMKGDGGLQVLNEGKWQDVTPDGRLNKAVDVLSGRADDVPPKNYFPTPGGRMEASQYAEAARLAHIEDDFLTKKAKEQAYLEKIGDPRFLSDTAKAGLPLSVLGKTNELGFYSNLERVMTNIKQNKTLADTATADQWLGYLRNNGVKAEELEYVLKDLPKDKQISKAELEKTIKENQIKIEEVEKGGISIADKMEKEINDIIAKEYTVKRGQRGWANAYDEVQERLMRKYNLEFDDAGKIVGDLPSSTKFHKWQLPGGENYRETLLKLPERNEIKSWEDLSQSKKNKIIEDYKVFKEGADIKDLMDWKYDLSSSIEKQAQHFFESNINKEPELKSRYVEYFQSPHWDEPNVLAHIRTNDRMIGNQKSMHIEEIQSDWLQKGREQGFKLEPKEKARLEGVVKQVDDKLNAAKAEDIMGNPDLKAGMDEAVKRKIITEAEAKDYQKLVKNENSTIPDAPFKNSWSDLALKRMIVKAAKEGYEGISWTPGEAQAARYDLSKQVKGIRWEPRINSADTIVKIDTNEGRTLSLQVNKNGKVVESFPGSQTNQFEGKQLSDVVGKEVAEKIMDKYVGHLKEEGLKIGGEGMKAFYDKMLVDKAKKYGSKVEERNIDDKGKYKFNVYDGQDNLLKTFNDRIDAEKFVKENPRTRQIKEEMVKGQQPIHYLPFTDALRKKALEDGFSLFSGAPTLTPISHDPFKTDARFKLIPIQGNPFE